MVPAESGCWHCGSGTQVSPVAAGECVRSGKRCGGQVTRVSDPTPGSSVSVYSRQRDVENRGPGASKCASVTVGHTCVSVLLRGSGLGTAFPCFLTLSSKFVSV